MIFKLEVDCGNAAFGDSPDEVASELLGIFATTIKRLRDGDDSGHARDRNGNTVGSWSYEDDIATRWRKLAQDYLRQTEGPK